MKLLNETQDLATASGLVLNRHLEAMLAREQGTRAGEDIEDLHMMRVSQRRLRAALVVFSGAINPRERKALAGELAWIGDALGAVRDLDVFLDRMTVTRAELPEDAARLLTVVDRVITGRRRHLREAMIGALDDPRYSAFVAGLRRRIEKHDLALFSGPSSNEPLMRAAREVLGEFAKKAVKAINALNDDSTAEALHAARKKVRRLRYGLNFLGNLYGAPAKRLRKEAKRIQDELGEHQDAIIAQEVLWSVVEELRNEGSATAETYVAIGQAIQREVRHADVAREQFFTGRGGLEAMVAEFKLALNDESASGTTSTN